MRESLVKELPIHTKIKNAKDKDSRSNRWLLDKLKDYSISLNDTQISNRLNGYISFSIAEIQACSKIFKIDFTKA
jgi:hypothetical protein